uniref:Uncharacterized protein n=1 Tax=Rhizophora mucronata TaxID=61149 RepID=A0A2P2K9T9_RHIMU
MVMFLGSHDSFYPLLGKYISTVQNWPLKIFFILYQQYLRV